MRDTPPDPSPASAPFPGELLIWLSPSFPIGSFAYSQGLETAVDQGWVKDRATLHEWLAAIIRNGALGNDLTVMSLVMRARGRSEIDDLAELSSALQPTAERAHEALDQGGSFIAAYRAGWIGSPANADVFSESGPITFSVAVAMAARAHDFDTAATLEAYAIAFCNNLLSAAIRLSVIGQFDGQRLMAELLPIVRHATSAAMLATIDDLGSATYGADLASMLHETQTTRLFRS
jgi:urease accessory protein